MKELLTCPHCGDKPEIETDGTWVEIYCCASMTVQKCDVLTIEERETWNRTSHKFSPEVEEKAFNSLADDWNKRN